MDAITVWQPWASLIAIGAKPYEFRPRSYRDYIGAPKAGARIAIQAGARPIRIGEVEELIRQLEADEPICLARPLALPFLMRVQTFLRAETEAKRRNRKAGSSVTAEEVAAAMRWDTLRLPLSAIVCTAVLGEPKRGDDCIREWGWSNDSDREGTFNWGWPMLKVRPVIPPVPARGAQGFWTLQAKLPEAA